MAIADGQRASETNFNAAFASKTLPNTLEGDQTFNGNVSLNAPGKGGTVPDLQEAVAGTHSHINNKSNPHDVTAEQVGKDTAQWNASKNVGFNLL